MTSSPVERGRSTYVDRSSRFDYLDTTHSLLEARIFDTEELLTSHCTLLKISNPVERGRSTDVDRSSRFDYFDTINSPFATGINDKDRELMDDELA